MRIVRLSGVEAFSYFVEITNLIPKVESMRKIAPRLEWSSFSAVAMANRVWIALPQSQRQKKAGMEGG